MNIAKMQDFVVNKMKCIWIYRLTQRYFIVYFILFKFTQQKASTVIIKQWLKQQFVTNKQTNKLNLGNSWNNWMALHPIDNGGNLKRDNTIKIQKKLYMKLTKLDIDR